MDWFVVWFEQHPGTASWAQAIGTLVALAIAVAVPLHQNYSLRRQAAVRSHEQALQLFDSLGAMADFAGAVVGASHRELQGEFVFLEGLDAYDPRVLAGITTELNRYPFYQLPDYESVTKALELKTSFSLAASHLERTVEAQLSGDLQAFNLAAACFNAEFDLYSETVKSFSAQANTYRDRIANS
ncbi:hypothetical protein ACQKC8_16575 [Stutzerimonas stutzeri]|uniref:hypothetical protein n=1 Tax=Stutzerimonas stutzeri TaxID=316 RepID=UPI003C309723